EIVDRETQFEAVGTRPPLVAGSAGADAGIVDEEVQPVRLLVHCRGQSAYFSKGSEIRSQELGSAAGRTDFADEALASLPVAPMRQHVHARFGELLGDHAADA